MFRYSVESEPLRLPLLVGLSTIGLLLSWFVWRRKTKSSYYVRISFFGFLLVTSLFFLADEWSRRSRSLDHLISGRTIELRGTAVVDREYVRQGNVKTLLTVEGVVFHLQTSRMRPCFDDDRLELVTGMPVTLRYYDECIVWIEGSTSQ